MSHLVHHELERQAEWRSDQTAFVFEGMELTFEEFDERTRRAAAVLADLGLDRGSVVAAHSRNHLDLYTLFYACSRLGCVFTTFPGQHSQSNAQYVMGELEPEVLFYTHDEAIVHGLLPLLRDTDIPDAFVSFDEVALDDDPSYGDLLSDADEPPAVDVSPEDRHNVFWTSGTTGRPKGAVRDHRTSINFAKPLLETYPFEEGSTRLSFRDMMHGGAYLQHGLPPLMNGETNVILRWFSPERVVDAIQEHDIDMTSFAFTANQVLNYTEKEGRSIDVPRTHSPIPSGTLARRLFEVHDEVYHLYATTEVGIPIVHQLDPDELTDSPTLGKPGTGTQVRLVRPDPDDPAAPDEVVDNGQPGELICKGMTTMNHYLNDEVQEENVRDGWLYTGDLLRRRDDGDLEFIGRVDNRIRSGGLNVYPENVERVLEGHSDVNNAIVIGVPDEKWGQRICALIVPKDSDIDGDQLAEAIDRYCLDSEEIARETRPKEYTVVETLDDVPKGTIGKYDREAITAMFQDD